MRATRARMEAMLTGVSRSQKAYTAMATIAQSSTPSAAMRSRGAPAGTMFEFRVAVLRVKFQFPT